MDTKGMMCSFDGESEQNEWKGKESYSESGFNCGYCFIFNVLYHRNKMYKYISHR